MQPEFRIEIDSRDDMLRVIVEGELDMATAPRLTAELLVAAASTTSMVVIDLAGMSFIDSAGLHALEQAHARSARNGGRLRLTPGPAQAQRLFKITGADHRLPFLRPTAHP